MTQNSERNVLGKYFVNQPISRREMLKTVTLASSAIFVGNPLSNAYADTQPYPWVVKKYTELTKELSIEDVEFQDGRAIELDPLVSWQRFLGKYEHNTINGNLLQIGVGNGNAEYEYGTHHEIVDDIYRFVDTPVSQPVIFTNKEIAGIEYQVSHYSPQHTLDTERKILAFIGHPSLVFNRKDTPDIPLDYTNTQVIAVDPATMNVKYISRVFGNAELFNYNLINRNGSKQRYDKLHIVRERKWKSKLDFLSYRWGMLCDVDGIAVDIGGDKATQPLYVLQYFFLIR